MGIAIALHLFAAVIWVGGMFFAYVALRPAAASLLEPPQRLGLWVSVFHRFFSWVWFAIITLLSTGYWMIFNVFNGFAHTGTHVHIMHGLGLLMVLIFFFVWFRPYRALRRETAAANYPAGAACLASIRKIIAINLTLGIITIIVGSAGRYI